MKTYLTKLETKIIRDRIRKIPMEDSIVPIYTNPDNDIVVWMLPNYLFTISIGNIELLDVYDIEMKDGYANVLNANGQKICKIDFKERC